MSAVGILVNIILSGTAAVLGTIGNACVIFVFVKMPSLRTVNNVFVTQLAVVDLLKACLILPVKVANQAQGKSSMNQTLCPLFGMLRTICSCQSALLLAAIAVVRFWKVVRPHRFHIMFSTRRTLLYCFSLVFGTLLLSMLPVLGVGVYKYSFSHGACFVNWSSENVVFRSIYYVFNVGISLPVLLYCYCKIFRVLRAHKRLVVPTFYQSEVGEVALPIEKRSSPRLGGEKRMVFASEHLTSSAQSTRHGVVPRSEEIRAGGAANARRGRGEFEVVVTQVMFATVIAYLICWTPAFITNALNLSKAVHFPKDVLLLAVTLVDMKVVVNPFIYVTSHRRFRKRAIRAFLQLNQE